MIDWIWFHIFVSAPMLGMLAGMCIDEIIDCFEVIEEDENDAEN